MAIHSTRRDVRTHNYRRDLAASLVAEMGYEGAVEFCYTNGWQGMLDIVERAAAIAERKTGLNAGRPGTH